MSTFFNLIYDYKEQGAEIIDDNISLLNYRKEIENEFKDFYFAKLSIENKPFKIEKDEENNFKIKDILYDECIYIFSLNFKKEEDIPKEVNSFKVFYYNNEVLINEHISDNLSLKDLRDIIDKNKKFSENFYFENNEKRISNIDEMNIKIKDIINIENKKIILKNYFTIILKKNGQITNKIRFYDLNIDLNLEMVREKMIKKIKNNFSSNFLFINKENKEINKKYEKNIYLNNIINDNFITIVALQKINIYKDQQIINSLYISLNDNLANLREQIKYNNNFCFLDKNNLLIEKKDENNKKINDIINNNNIYIEDDEKTELILFNNNVDKINNQLFFKAKNKLNEKNILELKNEKKFSFRTDDNIEFFHYKIDKELNSKLNEKNILNLLFIGETNSQKTKFINFFANYLLDIKNDDNIRFHLNEISTLEDLNSDIDNIEIYYISNNFNSIRIINIPEFDQKNFKNFNSEIIEKINNLFKNEILFINSIFFSINCENSQLFKNNEKLFENIMNIFDKEFLNNIKFIFSNSNKINNFFEDLNNKSKYVKKIFNKINKKKQCFFQFDNSILLSKDKEKWNNEIEKFHKLFNEIKNLIPIKTDNCIKIINSRIYIETKMNIKYEFKKYINEEDEKNKILDYQKDIISENNNLYNINNQEKKIDEYRLKTLIININQFKINFFQQISLFEEHINIINSNGINKNDFIGLNLLNTKIIENKEEKIYLNNLLNQYFNIKKKYYKNFNNNENNNIALKNFIKDEVENPDDSLCKIF